MAEVTGQVGDGIYIPQKTQTMAAVMLSQQASRVDPVDDAVWHIIASQPTGTKAISSSQPISGDGHA